VVLVRYIVIGVVVAGIVGVHCGLDLGFADYAGCLDFLESCGCRFRESILLIR